METSTVVHSRTILRGRSHDIESGAQPYFIAHRTGPYNVGDVIEFVEICGREGESTGRTFRKTITCVTELYRHFPGIGSAVIVGLKDEATR